MSRNTIKLATMPISYCMGALIGRCGSRLINEDDSAATKLMIMLGSMGFSYMTGYAFGKLIDSTLDDLEAGGITFK